MGQLKRKKIGSTSVLVLVPGIAVMALAGAGCTRHAVVARGALLPAAQTGIDPMARQVQNAVDLGEGDIELKVLRNRITASPNDLSARIALARHYYAEGIPEVALEHLRLACERAPESAEAHLELARMLRKEGQAAEAAKLLEAFTARAFTVKLPNSATNRSVNDVEVWAWLGVLRDETGAWKPGEEAHRKALALAPDRDDLHNNLGYCLLEQGRKDEAAEEFREALRLNKKSAFARDNLGIAVAGTPKEAVLHWQSVSDPASAHSNMAAVLIESGDYPGARKEIAVALSYNQQHTAALSNLRLLSLLDGKPAEYSLARNPSRWSRIRATWQKFWISKPEESSEQIDSGKAVASR